MSGRGFFMDGSKRRDYAFASTVGAISMLVWTASRASARDLPYGGSSLLIGLGLLVGLKHPVRRQIYDHLRLLPGDHFRSVARSLRLAVGSPPRSPKSWESADSSRRTISDASRRPGGSGVMALSIASSAGGADAGLGSRPSRSRIEHGVRGSARGT